MCNYLLFNILDRGSLFFTSLHSSPTNHVICPLASIYSQTYHDHAADDYLFPENPRYAMLSSCCYDYIHDIQIPVLYVSMFQQKYDDLILDSLMLRARRLYLQEITDEDLPYREPGRPEEIYTHEENIWYSSSQ